jgi:acyl carrier protein
MERETIVYKLTDVFRKVFNNEALELRDNLTANDVENWDSLSHMILISEIENTFNVKFRLKELNKMRNVGEMIDLLIQKQ